MCDWLILVVVKNMEFVIVEYEFEVFDELEV